jgi:3-dehydroquinate dehydratase-2
MRAALAMSVMVMVMMAMTPAVAGHPSAAQSTPAARLRILLIHGPNMNLLGRREPQIYGTMTLDQVNSRIAEVAKEINVDLTVLQTNDEAVIVDTFQKHIDDMDGAIINAAGLSFTAVSIHDVIKAMPFPVIEVHMSNLGTRDEIHQHSILTPAVRGTVMGLGWRSYTAALRAVAEIVREDRANKKK